MDSTLACLAAWMPRQRWYAAKGRQPSLRLVAWWDLACSDPGVAAVRTYLVSDEGALPAVLYQIPVVARITAQLEADPSHLIGSPEPGLTFVDGPHDPAYSRALLQLIAAGGEATGPGATARGVPAMQVASLPDSPAVLSGEQSNTSVIFRGAEDVMPIICKVFRQVQPGVNPDIELASALATAGSPHVPRAVGSVSGTWPDPATAQGSIHGSLSFAQEFLPDVEDAWRVALHAAATGEDFGRLASELGQATAEVHLALAQLLGAHAMTEAERHATTAAWRRRLAIAIAEVPAIARQREAIEAVYDAATAVAWPPAQRIHGDYHLGQVLHVPGRGWVLLDFEGEPLRPIGERTRPDLALRDIAGMLRSFDYVAGSIRLDDPERPPEAVRAWAQVAREGFLAGYSTAGEADLVAHAALLSALELDKAVYEAIYESRNRPTWVAIPLRAIARLLEQPVASA